MTDYKQFRLFGQFFEIVCGTNEEFLIGFHIIYREVSHYFDRETCMFQTMLLLMILS